MQRPNSEPLYQLSLGCSMRIGEILGLTWDDIHIEPELIESGDAYLHIGKQLQRLRKEDKPTRKSTFVRGLLEELSIDVL